jgi:hypothetical protein
MLPKLPTIFTLATTALATTHPTRLLAGITVPDTPTINSHNLRARESG